MAFTYEILNNGKSIHSLAVSWDDGFQQRLLFSNKKKVRECLRYIKKFHPEMKKLSVVALVRYPVEI